IVVFDAQDLEKFGREHPDADLVLVRPDTVPDDIGMIFECNGLLTARGGAASHAAVTAVRLGKTCVVNCRVLTVLEKEKRCIINGVEFHPGDKIAIDGRSGHIYKGNYPIGMAAPLELP
nr:PEP-utilizing enzyme [bacterium]